MRVIVVGAGPGGLAAAWTIRQTWADAAEVRILEADTQAGGLAVGFRGEAHWEWPLERYYHHLFTNDDDIIGLTRELGLSGMLEIHSPVTAYLHAGKSHRLDSIGSLLAFPDLSLPQKLRMGLVMAYLRWHPRPPWSRFDTVTAHQWLRSRMGIKEYETIWQPLLEGKFGSRYPDVSLAWFAARLYKRTPNLGYFTGGFQAWSEAVLDAVQSRGVQVELSVSVSGIAPGPEGEWQVQTSQGPREADAVLFTGAPGVLSRLCPTLPSDYRQRLSQDDFMGAAVLTLALDRSVTEGIYWISVPARAGLPFLAVVEHTAMIDPSHYGGHHILYLGAYVEQDHRYLTMAEEELTEEFVAALPAIHPEFDPSWVQGAWPHRTAYAQPIPYPGGGKARLSLRTPRWGLYLATMSQVWPWDRGTNYAVQLGRQAAQTMMEDFSLPHSA